jgi:hypothetical protein
LPDFGYQPLIGNSLQNLRETFDLALKAKISPMVWTATGNEAFRQDMPILNRHFDRYRKFLFTQTLTMSTALEC